MDDAAQSAQPAGEADASRARTRRRAQHARRPSVVGVLGEILITLGVVTLLFVAWQLWIGDVIYGAERTQQADAQSDEWQREYEEQIAASPEVTETPAPADTTAEPIILPQPDDAQTFATMHIPRFGPEYNINVAGGVTRANTLDPIGIGHYPGTQMPGEEGNFAVAAHRTTWGKPFNRIAELRVGDAIVVETPDGWYTYRFRTLEYVEPSAVEVILPVPQETGVAANDRYLTMTSCSPMYSMAERIVAYSVFENFTPRSAGAPASLTGGVA
ncbi:class E sortase [Microbacterium sp. SS28]|uniref:class E sortase n=1 Tax=Microbacterium sp. SS28 TaxID=2919948 RepID=UPI001FA9B06E|nr:class E sortase [Microbacterium sp. SS28]